MALLDDDLRSETGVCLLLPPAWRQGFYWVPSMATPRFCDSPKSLPNDVVWLTNGPFEVVRQYGTYIKHNQFFRTPFSLLWKEIAGESEDPVQQLRTGVPFFTRLGQGPEQRKFRDALTLATAYREASDRPSPHSDWEQIGKEARTWYWKGSVKHPLLMGASLLAPRYEIARQLVRMPILDTSKPPRIVRADMRGDVLRSFLQQAHGFVRLRVESIDRKVEEFVELDRMLWTTTEALWLMSRSQVTLRVAYLADPVEHPALGWVRGETFLPFSWLDGLRMEAAFLSPGVKDVAQEAWLRGLGHLAMAVHAEYLSTGRGVPVLGLGLGKIKVALSASERAKIGAVARDAGLRPVFEELAGTDFSKETY